MSNLGNVKKFREENGLTQKQMSEICGVTLRTVQNWEAGKTIPDNIVKLLRSLGGKGGKVSPLSVGGIHDCDTVNSPVGQHVKRNKNSFSGSGDITHCVSTEIFQQALNEITEMRQLLAESVRNTNDLSQNVAQRT